MAGNYSGYFLKGLGSGLQSGINMGQQLQEMRWQKKQRKALEEKQSKMLEVSNIWNAQIKEAGADYNFSDKEIAKLTTTMLSGGYEFIEHYNSALNAIKSMNKAKYDQELEWMDLFANGVERCSPGDVQALYEYVKPNITSEKGLNQLEALNNFLTKKSEIMQAQPITEVFPSAETVREKYPKAGVRYTDEGYVPTFGEPTEVKEPTFNEKRFNWKIDQLKAGNITTDQFLKSEGMYIAPEKKTSLESEIDLMIKYGATNEEIKDKLLSEGGGGTTLKPTPASVESLREDIKNAPTLEDAKRMEKNHIAKYGDTLGIPNVDKFWSDERVRRLNTLKQGIDKLLDEKKRLKKGTITSAEVGFEIEDDIQKVEAVYKQLREEYMKYRDMLEKMGVDLNQFPELMSYEEYNKADIKPKIIYDPRTWGKQKPSIY